MFDALMLRSPTLKALTEAVSIHEYSDLLLLLLRNEVENAKRVLCSKQDFFILEN